MERVTFGRTGLKVSPLGFGGGPVGFLDTEASRVADILRFLHERGVNLIDTAAAYQGSEEVIGKAITGQRDDWVIVSKCGHETPGITAPAWSAALITQSVDRSLSRLGIEYLDAMLLHSCELDTLQQGDALSALLEARRVGKIRHVGYSGDNHAAVWAAAHPEIDVLETSVNICDQTSIDAVMPVAQAHDVAVIAKRPVANGAWKAADLQQGIYRGYAQPYSDRLQRMGVAPSELGFGGDTSAAWPEIALRFTVGQPGVHTAIIGTTDPAHAAANVAATARGPLDTPVVVALREAFRRAEAASGEEWVGLR